MTSSLCMLKGRIRYGERDKVWEREQFGTSARGLSGISSQEHIELGPPPLFNLYYYWVITIFSISIIINLTLIVKSPVPKYSYIGVSVQFSSVTQSCLTLCDPMNCSMPGLPVHHQLPEFAQTHVHWVGDAIQPSHLLSSPSPTPNPSQHQGLFQWVNSSHDMAKILEFQL